MEMQDPIETMPFLLTFAESFSGDWQPLTDTEVYPQKTTNPLWFPNKQNWLCHLFP
jgi:hypothetical protein